MPKDTDPQVELAPKINIGDTVIHIGEQTEHKVEKIHPDKSLSLSGIAGRIRPDAVRPK